MPSSPQVVVIGLGYVGCVTAACLAKLGHRVIGVDCQASKVEAVSAGRAPFYEPGLDDIVRQTVAAGRLSASANLAEALEHASIALICVATPAASDGSLDPEPLRRVVREIAECLPGRNTPLLVAVRSTVFPGTCEEVVAPALGSVVANPEFLREGSAVRDFMEDPLVVVGGSDPVAVATVAGLFAPLGVQPVLVPLRTAEFIKYACNGFHALKIAFSNEIGALGASLCVDPAEVMEALCRDTRLNISAAYLKPGFAFGGSCLPKDQRVLAHTAARLGLRLPLIESVLPSNREHLERALRRVLDLPAARIGVFGLAFKQDTDDVRESPAAALVESLIAEGRDVRAFDANVRSENSFDDLLSWAQVLVLTRKPAAQFAEQIRSSGIPVLDLA